MASISLQLDIEVDGDADEMATTLAGYLVDAPLPGGYGMTYDEWVKTERQHSDITAVDNAFGYVPEGKGWGVKSVVSYAQALP